MKLRRWRVSRVLHFLALICTTSIPYSIVASCILGQIDANTMPIGGRNGEHMSATGRQRTYVHLRTLEPPIKVPQHCIAPHCQEHYTSGAANGRNVARHRDNNTVYLHCYALPNVCRNRSLVCPRNHLSNVPQRQVDLSVASKVLKPFANYATAIINHTTSTVWHCKNVQERLLNDLLKPNVILRIFVRKRYNDIVTCSTKEKEWERKKKNRRETCLVLYRQVDTILIFVYIDAFFK